MAARKQLLHRTLSRQLPKKLPLLRKLPRNAADEAAAAQMDARKPLLPRKQRLPIKLPKLLLLLLLLLLLTTTTGSKQRPALTNDCEFFLNALRMEGAETAESAVAAEETNDQRGWKKAERLPRGLGRFGCIRSAEQALAGASTHWAIRCRAREGFADCSALQKNY